VVRRAFPGQHDLAVALYVIGLARPRFWAGFRLPLVSSSVNERPNDE